MSSKNDVMVLTPEHVQVLLPTAGLGSRFLAVIVDGIIVLFIFLIAYLVLLDVVNPNYAFAIAAIIIFVLNFGYHIFFELKNNGQSPGKMVAGLRVVDDKGLPITFQQSFVRNIIRLLDNLPAFYGIGGIACLIDNHNRRFGDIAAGTIVICEKKKDYNFDQIARPRRFNVFDNPRAKRLIRHRISLEEREFLLSLCLRAGQLNEKEKFDLMKDAGQYFSQKLEVEDRNISGENIVLSLTAAIYSKK